jgi:hypothetical protein
LCYPREQAIVKARLYMMIPKGYIATQSAARAPQDGWRIGMLRTPRNDWRLRIAIFVVVFVAAYFVIFAPRG